MREKAAAVTWRSTKFSVIVSTIGIWVLASFISLSALGQTLPPGVTPGMLEELKSMPAAQQQALAEQYGISLPVGMAASADMPNLAAPGSSLPAPEQMTEDNGEEITTEEPAKVDTKASERYGRRLFSRDVSTFAPTDDAPVPDSYRLGVGDQLVVQLFGKENEQFNLQIGRNGDVSFPKLGSITLSGLSFEGARELIDTRVKQQLIGVDTVVTMGRLRAINVFMAGEVSVPGAYSVSAMATVTQALFQAGGVTDIGSLRDIQVRRAGSIIARFDAYDLLLQGDVSGDIRLRSGDVVFVPPYTGVIDVQGELKRPMIYELYGDETIGEVLTMAGSFTGDAYIEQSVLTRQSELGLPQAITIDLSDASYLSLAARDGDTIFVPKVGTLLINSVALKGAVTRPGNYGWVPGMRVSSLIGNARRDLSSDADLSLGAIVRQKNALLDIEVIAFDVGALIESPNSDVDPELQEFDEVLVFSLDTTDTTGAARKQLLSPVIEKLSNQARKNEPVQTVSVSGAVRVPGTYPLTSGATVETLINLAGGLTDSAFLEAAELRRLTEQSDGQITTNYQDLKLSGRSGMRVSLSSRDHLNIREIPDWSPSDSIIVEGEVRFPGQYRIRKGEKLSSVILRAGGFTDNASLESAIFTRKAIAELEAERAAEFAREIQNTHATRLLTEETTTQGVDEISKIISALRSVEGVGRMLIDLPAVMSKNPIADVEVEDGDRIVVPILSNTVSVVGEVRRQGTHSFRRDLNVDDYIELSAGLTRRADDTGIYLVKANGSIVIVEQSLWRFSGNSMSLAPGDTIVIPINTQYKESLASWREITQIVYQSMVSIAAVAGL